jgi:peptidoglycan/LPS O-acetylase OafA/YrhL
VKRRDIQFLRGVAVLLVVASHAFHRWLPYGDLGVDVFFVISGFLMTSMIVSGLDRGDFTFGGFYLRRARRLLPASIATVTFTLILAPILLPSEAWRPFAWQVVGALTFTANLVSQAQLGGIHELQPLAHFWSLSLEEQFYLLFPLLLWLSPKPFRPSGVAFVAAQSFIVMLAFGTNYLLPGRGWELLVGALAFYAREKPMPSFAKWAALIAVGVSVAFSLIPLAVVATAVMLIGKDDWVRVPPVEKIGDWSYSIYLIHWPLLSFAAAYYLATPPPLVASLLAVASIGLAALQYRFVEQPFRGRGPGVRPYRSEPTQFRLRS